MRCADGPPSVSEIPPMPTDHIGSANAIAISGTHWSSQTVPQLRRWGLSSVRAQRSSRQGRGRAHGRVNQISVDGIADRRVRNEKKGGARCRHVGVAVHGEEPSVRTWY